MSRDDGEKSAHARAMRGFGSAVERVSASSAAPALSPLTRTIARAPGAGAVDNAKIVVAEDASDDAECRRDAAIVARMSHSRPLK